MTSKLYEEAIADSKKLKSLLREEVEKDLIEQVKPLVEEALRNEINSFLLEQEEGVDAGAPPKEDAAAQAPQAEEEQPLDLGGVDDAAKVPQQAPTDASVAAPITPVGGNMSMPLPGPDGMITVSFTDLFSTSSTPTAAPEPTPAPAAEPAPAPEPAAASKEEETQPAAQQPAGEPAAAPADKTGFNPENLQEASLLVNSLENEFVELFESGEIGLREKSNYTYKLLEVYAELEDMKNSRMIRESVFNVLAYKMENLNKLIQNSEKLLNSYLGTNTLNEGNRMKVHPKTTSLIHSLLESLETGFGDDGEVTKVSEPLDSTEKVADKASKAGQAASRPKVVDSDRGKQAPFKHKAKEDESLLKEEYGDELDEDLDEQIAALEEELAGLDMDAEEDEEEVEEVPAPVMESKKSKKGSHSKKALLAAKAKKLKEQLEEVQEELDECGMDASPMGASSGKVTITVDSEGSQPVVSTSSKSMDDEDMDEMDMFEVVMDEEEEEEDSAMEMKNPTAGLNESRVIKDLKANLASNEHLLARSIYTNKLFANYDLSRKQKQLVVEYLDKAQSVDDAKRIYGRIKKQLNEAKVVEQQSDKKANSLNESVSRKVSQPQNPSDRIVVGTAERFKQLVGNKKSQ
jgi:hypothetical protein